MLLGLNGLVLASLKPGHFQQTAGCAVQKYNFCFFVTLADNIVLILLVELVGPQG